MRVLLIIYGALEQQSGGYRYDARLLSFLEKKGHQVRVFSQAGGSYLARLLQDRPGAILRAAKEHRADLVLEDELNHPSLIRSNRRLTRHGIPIVSIVHHLAEKEEHGWIRGLVVRLVERRYLRSIDGSVYNTATTREDVEALLRGSLPGVVSLPSADGLRETAGSSSSATSPERHSAPEETGSAELRLLTVGSLTRRKRIDAVIGALALLEGKRPTLTIVGSDAPEPYTAKSLRRLSGRLGVAEGVTFLGGLDEGELDRAYREHDLFVLPSQYEGFGMVYLEAMARGLPVIAGDAGGARTIVRHGTNGYLTKAGSAAGVAQLLAAIMERPEELRRLSRGALETARRHPTWEESFAPAEEFLRRLATERGSDGL